MTEGLDLGLTRRRRIVPVLQSEVAECGLAALAMIANYHGMKVDLGTLRRQFQPSLRGASLRSLIATADQISLVPRAVKLPLEKLARLHLPAILHWDMNHFVVVEEVQKGRVLVHNPEKGSRWLDLEEVSRHFTGVALELRPSENFEAVDRRSRLRLRQLWSNVTGLKRALLQVVVLTLLLQIFVLASPYYMQIAVDNVVPANDTGLLLVLAIGFGFFAVFNAVSSLMRSFVLLSAGTAVGYGVANNLARRLIRLPISWFEKRHVGDVLSRFQSITPIRTFMTEGAVGVLLDGSLAVLTLALMTYYSAVLSACALAALIAYLATRMLFFHAQRAAQEEAISASGKEQSAMIETLRGITTVRLFNKEVGRHAMWQSRLVSSMNASVALARLDAWQANINVLIFGMETVVSVYIATRLVLGSGFSIGMVIAFFAYKTDFLQRAGKLVDEVVSIRMLALHLERISDVALTPADRCFQQDATTRSEATGAIELRHISFRYSDADPFVLKDASLRIEAGDFVALTGPSGGGKSTLVKILLGLVEPTGGQVLVDDQPLSQFGYANFREQVGAVLQDDALFGGSLADNIALFDENPDMDRVRSSAEAAAIHDDITAMPMGYETLVGDMGSSLSGGQRQRLLLARAIYKRPRILVLDEATSHLDAAREEAVNEAITSLGITRVIIAHRQETIMSAQKAFVVMNGMIEDITDARGTRAGTPVENAAA